MFCIFYIKTRGYNGPGGWIMQDVTYDLPKTKFTWLLNTDLKVEFLFCKQFCSMVWYQKI